MALQHRLRLTMRRDTELMPPGNSVAGNHERTRFAHEREIRAVTGIWRTTQASLRQASAILVSMLPRHSNDSYTKCLLHRVHQNGLTGRAPVRSHVGPQVEVQQSEFRAAPRLGYLRRRPRLGRGHPILDQAQQFFSHGDCHVGDGDSRKSTVPEVGHIALLDRAANNLWPGHSSKREYRPCGL